MPEIGRLAQADQVPIDELFKVRPVTIQTAAVDQALATGMINSLTVPCTRNAVQAAALA